MPFVYCLIFSLYLLRYNHFALLYSLVKQHNLFYIITKKDIAMEIIVFEGIWRYHIYLATYDDLLLCHTARTLNLDTIMLFLVNLESPLLLGCPCTKLGRQNKIIHIIRIKKDKESLMHRTHSLHIKN